MCHTGELSISDLMKGLGDAKAKMGPARKALMKMAKQAEPLATPLPGPIRERQERKAGYETTKEDITKWQPLVKVNHPHKPYCITPTTAPLMYRSHCIAPAAPPLLHPCITPTER